MVSGALWFKEHFGLRSTLVYGALRFKLQRKKSAILRVLAAPLPLAILIHNSLLYRIPWQFPTIRGPPICRNSQIVSEPQFPNDTAQER